MSWPDPVTLTGRHAVLAPLASEHATGLAEAVKDGEVWRLWYTRVPPPHEMSANIEWRLARRAAGWMLPFVVLEPDGLKPAGMTTYCNIDAEHRRVEIGYTWYRAGVRRTALNTECKLMLLSHAFDELDCIAVELRTNAFNYPSRRAIERLGAKLDGVLRHHQRNDDGTLRDTYVYSIIASEWPTVRSHLKWQLERPR
jgi:RimJ/RimL family protein N-acetyltransferase